MYFLEDLDEEEYEIAIKVCYFLVVSNDRLCDFNYIHGIVLICSFESPTSKYLWHITK